MAGLGGRLGTGRPQLPMRALGSVSPTRVLRLSENALASLNSPQHRSSRGAENVDPLQMSSPPLSRISADRPSSGTPAWSPPNLSDDEDWDFSTPASAARPAVRPAARPETAREGPSVPFRMKWDDQRSAKLIAVCLDEKKNKPNMFKNHTTMEKVSMNRVNDAFWRLMF